MIFPLGDEAVLALSPIVHLSFLRCRSHRLRPLKMLCHRRSPWRNSREKKRNCILPDVLYLIEAHVSQLACQRNFPRHEHTPRHQQNQSRRQPCLPGSKKSRGLTPSAPFSMRKQKSAGLSFGRTKLVCALPGALHVLRRTHFSFECALASEPLELSTATGVLPCAFDGDLCAAR